MNKNVLRALAVAVPALLAFSASANVKTVTQPAPPAPAEIKIPHARTAELYSLTEPVRKQIFDGCMAEKNDEQVCSNSRVECVLTDKKHPDFPPTMYLAAFALNQFLLARGIGTHVIIYQDLGPDGTLDAVQVPVDQKDGTDTVENEQIRSDVNADAKIGGPRSRPAYARAVDELILFITLARKTAITQ